MPTYEPRYCAFVDILGFSRLIVRLREGETQFLALRSLLQTVHSPGPAIPTVGGDPDIRSQSISDAVAISTAVNEYGLWQLFETLEVLTHHLLESGFFIRGAIVKGKLYHDEKMVFGEALVDAYNLEKNVVHYPRVMITRNVFNDAVAYSKNDEWEGVIRLAKDGPRFLHVLGSFAAKMPEPFGELINPIDPTEIDRYVKMRSQIERRLEEAVDNPRHYEKVNWFAEYWNEHCVPVSKAPIPALKGLEPIKAPLGFVPKTIYQVETTMPQMLAANKPKNKP